MNEIEVFNDVRFGSVRVLKEGDRILLCGSDIARALGYSRPNDALSAHCRATVKRRTPISGKMQEVNYIPESDVYRLIIHSKLPGAQEFETWVFEKVLPSIRQHGGYIAGQETLSDNELLAKALLVAQNVLAEREARLAEERAKNQVLAGENLEWADRSFILKAVRSLGSAFGDYAKAWMLFKQELLYKHHINLKTRHTNALKAIGGKTEIPVLDMLHEDEVVRAAQSIMSLCTEHGVDLSWVITKCPAAREASGM